MIVKLPRKHAEDWYSRCGVDLGTEVKGKTKLTIKFDLTDEGLRDLISDAEHYVQSMGTDNTGDIDYRPAAKRCLVALRKEGFYKGVWDK